MSKCRITGVVAVFLALAACGRPASESTIAAAGPHSGVQYDREKVLNVYSWSDYVAPDTVSNFEKETGIKVRYDVYESNEVLETRLFIGHTNYDIVVPSGGPSSSVS